jgi:L-lactate dehydrogenase complex protein LldG
MERDTILHRVRTALGRTATDPPREPPPVYLRIPDWDRAERISRFTHAQEALGGRVYSARGPAAVHAITCDIVGQREAVISGDPFLRECGIGGGGIFASAAEIRAAAEHAAVGITGAAYGLAETGSLVMFASDTESRLISLLPPVHVAIFQVSRLLVNLDELLSRLPDPAGLTSAMVIITGPSRTADIEQILVRGVHGPGEVHVILADTETE